MGKPPLNVTCHCCGGTGKRLLSPVYQETMEMLSRLCNRRGRGYVVANQDAAYFGCSPAALSNRLSALEGHGLAVSEWCGKQRRFRPAR